MAKGQEEVDLGLMFSVSVQEDLRLIWSFLFIKIAREIFTFENENYCLERWKQCLYVKFPSL